jgi:hypothetical protein
VHLFVVVVALCLPGLALTHRGLFADSSAAARLIAGKQTMNTTTTRAVPVRVPPDGMALFGVQLDWETDSPSAFVARTGIRPAQYGAFVQMPLTVADRRNLSAAADAVAGESAALFLTVEPMAGLSAVTAGAARDLASTLAGYNSRGIAVYVRFAHEMNGSWYPWGQQPTAYVAAFRTVATAVHRLAPNSAMVWSPNYAGGYPFQGGPFSASAGTAAFTTLDTDHNGNLSMGDDPYRPFYPGDSYVDWVGLTLYHFGHAWPYGENEEPLPGTVSAALRGTWDGAGVAENQSALPDFYAQYAVARSKPMAVSETAALYNETPPAPGADETTIKSVWIDQLLGSEARSGFPKVKMVNWFEVRKFESEVGGIVDWRVTRSAAVRAVLLSRLRSGSYVGIPSS